MKKGTERIMTYIFVSKFNRLMIAFISLLLILLTYISVQFINETVPFEEELPNDGMIELLDIAEPSARYIEAITSSEEFERNYVDLYDHFDTQELIELSNKSYVENIYVTDEGYLNNLYFSEEDKELLLFSIPNLITELPGYEVAYPGTKGFLIDGRLPLDNMYEVVVSYEQLQNHWDFEGDINDAIGMTIDIDQTPYQIVGLTNLSITTLSYQDDRHNHYGVISVTKDSEEYLENMYLEMKKQGYSEDDLFARNIFIQYNEDYTVELMSYLVNHAPSYQYSSNYVNDILTRYYYKGVLPELIVLSTSLGILFGSFIFIVGRKSFMLINDYIKDVDNQNFTPKINATKLYAVLLIDFLLALPFCLLFTYLGLESLNGLFMLLPVYLICLLIFVLTLFILRKVVEYDNN
ncbi:hypothetical protein [Amphibacillus indicireducens]|uniref:MacB-like periplasmic core domain-containing protein n=1 Tax=Amphibacillus indicireducens TaxID=1076330 RepID=A0ABP7W223_9BACI